jgi:hypothetical protein
MPQGMIKLKEFQDLKQGYLSVTEYITHFSRLSHYALIDVDPDEKKQDYFLDGINDGQSYALEAHDIENFEAMVNKALVLENHQGAMERKHNLER